MSAILFDHYPHSNPTFPKNIHHLHSCVSIGDEVVHRTWLYAGSFNRKYGGTEYVTYKPFRLSYYQNVRRKTNFRMFRCNSLLPASGYVSGHSGLTHSSSNNNGSNHHLGASPPPSWHYQTARRHGAGLRAMGLRPWGDHGPWPQTQLHGGTTVNTCLKKVPTSSPSIHPSSTNN
jgi:hypothetical protein